MIIVNLTSTIVKERILDPIRFWPLPWDRKIGEPQSTDDLLISAKSVAMSIGAIVVDKHPDDPPRVLAPKFKKGK